MPRCLPWLAQLRSTKPFSEVYFLSSQKTKEGDPQHPVEFTIYMHWEQAGMIKRTLQERKAATGLAGDLRHRIARPGGGYSIGLSLAPSGAADLRTCAAVWTPRAPMGSNHGGAIRPMANRQKELGAFYRSLPDEKDVTDIMAVIYASAGAYGVELKEASYHHGREGQAPD